MARTVGSKNRNKTDLEFSLGIQSYWGKADKVDLINEKLLDMIVNGGHRDSMTAIAAIMKQCAVPMEKRMETDAAVEVAEMNKIDILDAINSLKDAKA